MVTDAASFPKPERTRFYSAGISHFTLACTEIFVRLIIREVPGETAPQLCVFTVFSKCHAVIGHMAHHVADGDLAKTPCLSEFCRLRVVVRILLRIKAK